MESTKNLGWMLVGLALGAAGLALITRKHKYKSPWDVDGILRACDHAASKLETLVREEAHGASATS